MFGSNLTLTTREFEASASFMKFESNIFSASLDRFSVSGATITNNCYFLSMIGTAISERDTSMSISHVDLVDIFEVENLLLSKQRDDLALMFNVRNVNKTTIDTLWLENIQLSGI